MAITAKDYKELKSLPEEMLTQEARDAIADYERQDAKFPSPEELAFAKRIIDEDGDTAKRNSNEKLGFRAQASDILKRERRAREVMRKKGQNPWVVPVKTKPEDIQSGYDFNWISAYENATDEPLEATEADADKLQKFIDANMFEVGDPSTNKWGNSLLKKRAYEMHMYNPNTMTWEDFINSDQWPEFQKYLNDVRKYQEGKEINKIWNEGVDPVRGLTSFMLPVSYEYAKKNYKDINGLGDIAIPLAADAAANIAMTGTGINTIKNPWTRWVLENATAPAITEATNYGLGNKSAAKAATDFITGAATNLGTPVMLEGFGNRLTRFVPTKTNNKRAEWQNTLNDAATKARKDKKMLDEGQAVLVNKDIGIDDHGQKMQMAIYKGQPYVSDKVDMFEGKALPVSEMPKESYTLPRIDDDEYRLGLAIANKSNKELHDFILVGNMGGWSGFGKTSNAERVKNLQTKILNKLNKGEELTKAEKYVLLDMTEESKLNRLKNSKLVQSSAPLIKNYLTNAAGREQAGQRVIGGPLYYLFGTNPFEKDGKETTDQKIERLFGVKKKKENDK